VAVQAVSFPSSVRSSAALSTLPQSAIAQLKASRRAPTANLFSSSTLINDLEKHIDDYYKGKGNLSSGVSKQIGRLNNKTSNTLATIDPRSLLAYRSYQTMMPYGSRSRFISGFEENTRLLQSLQSPKQIQLPANIQDVVNSYLNNQENAQESQDGAIETI